MSTMANIFHMTANGIIKMGRFDARELLKQIRKEETEDLGFGVRYYKDNIPHLAGVIFFGPGKNEIRGLEILEDRPWTMVYVNVIRKTVKGKEKFIMKISDALKPDKKEVNKMNNNEYQNYLERCKYYTEEPLSYGDWLQDTYEQWAIDQSRLTDAERYGED